MKRCNKCGQVKALAEFSPDRRQPDGRQGKCRICRAEHARLRYESTSDTVCQRVQRGYAALRSAVFDHYGWVCRCCGTSDDLAIDHVNGDTKAHLAQLIGEDARGRHGGQVYRWLIKNGFPAGFQTLCRRCNGSKQAGKSCRINHEAVA